MLPFQQEPPPPPGRKVAMEVGIPFQVWNNSPAE